MAYETNQTFIKAEIQEINKHKWIESEKAGRDLGYEAIVDWIAKYSKKFENEWFNKKRSNVWLSTLVIL